MRKRAKIYLSSLAGVLVLGLIALLYSQREPRYNGRSLSDWLAISFSAEISQTQREEAATAIRQIGQKGLHLLVKRASSVPATEGIKKFVRNHRMRLIPTSVWKWANRDSNYARRNEAKIGMMILGSAAAPAIPELTRLAATRGDSWAFEALGDIGPPALPVLLTFLNNQRAPAASRAYAAQQFRKLGTNALVALPSLIQCLSDTNVWFACCCATAIADLTLEPKTSIPALAKCLRSTHQTLRVISVQSIARFGPAAKLVLSELKEAETSETDLPTKDYLQRVIEKIDPSAPPFRMQLRAF